jgi:hypothetical protein
LYSAYTIHTKPGSMAHVPTPAANGQALHLTS